MQNEREKESSNDAAVEGNGGASTETARPPRESKAGAIVEEFPAEPDAQQATEQLAPPAPETTSASAKGESDGFFARLRMALRGFSRGWAGLPIEIPPGEEGTVPVAEANAAQRKLEKQLNKAHTTTEKLREEIARRDQQLAEKESELRELQREFKRARSEATDAADALQRDLRQAQETTHEREADIERLETQLAARALDIATAKSENENLVQQINNARAGAEEQQRAYQSELQHRRDEIEEQRNKFESERSKSIEQAAEREVALRDAADKIAGQLRVDLAARDDTIADLRGQMQRADAAAGERLAAALQEAESARQAAAHKDSAAAILLTEIKEHEAEADRLRGETEGLRQQHGEENSRWQKKLADADSAMEKLRAELVNALAERDDVEALRQRALQAERELARKAEEASLLREDARALRQRTGEFEAKLAAAEELAEKRGSFERESTRQRAQLEAVRDQLTEAQLRSQQLQDVLREFYAPLVSSVQVVAVNIDLLEGSKSLGDSDRETIVEMRQSMDQLRQALQKLAAKMAELGIS